MGKARKQRSQTSVKQILVRDFNWRMGNLRRIRHSLWGTTDAFRNEIDRAVHNEAERQKCAHEARLAAISPENIDSAASFILMTEDPILADAIWKVQQQGRVSD